MAKVADPPWKEASAELAVIPRRHAFPQRMLPFQSRNYLVNEQLCAALANPGLLAARRDWLGQAGEVSVQLGCYVVVGALADIPQRLPQLTPPLRNSACGAVCAMNMSGYGRPGLVSGRLVARTWQNTVNDTVKSVKTEAERRARPRL